MDFLLGGLTAIGGLLMKAVLPAIATALSAMAVRLVQQQLKRVGLELTKEQQEAFRRLVENAIVAVEELARRRASAGVPMTPEEKRDTATGLIVQQAPDADPVVISQTIDAMLPKVRQIIPATAARPPVPSTPATFGRDKH